MKLFLGGTCNNSNWRDLLTPQLTIDYFNPVVPNWTPECQAEEIKQRQECDLVLYVITPKMTGVYSIAEAVDDSNKRPEKTIFCVLEKDGSASFNAAQLSSLKMVSKMIKENGGTICKSLEDIASFVNKNSPVNETMFKRIQNIL